METLGLGVRLNFDDNMTREINPLIRDLERLRNAATRTTRTFDNMSGAYNPFGSQRRRELQDYHASMQDTGRTLLTISDRLIRATTSANNLGKAMNAMQFSGNMNRLYSDVMRVQRMLGNMGYATTKMQKDMMDTRAFDTLNYKMRDLEDRIKLTTKALQEMEKAGGRAKYGEEFDLATRSLRAMNNELARAGNLRQRLADTHGYGMTSSGGKDVLYRQADTAGEALKYRMMGLAMRDMAVASNIAYNSLDKTGKMMTGLGYTTMEARQKLTQLTGTLTTAGMALTQFATVPLAIATFGLGLLVKQWEDAVNVMHGRTLMPQDLWKDSGNAVRDIAVDTGVRQMQVGQGYSLAYNKYGDKGMDYVAQQTENAAFMFQVHGVAMEKSIADVGNLMTKLGVDSDTAWDMYVAGAVEAKKETGKGFTGMNGIDRIMETIEASPEKFKNLTGATGEFNGAFEKMVDNFEKGFFENMIESVMEMGSTLIAIVKPLEPYFDRFFGVVNGGMQKLTGYFRDNEGISKWVGTFMLLGLGLGMALGPISLLTGFMIRYRNVIQGVALAVAGFNKGGLALLPPQAKMAMNAMRAFTVSIARLPQTLLLGAIPALYTFVRGLPAMALNIARLNPLMTALTLGTIAYAKNWGGFGDAVEGVLNKIKNSWRTAKTIMELGLGGTDFELSNFSQLTQVFAKVQGTAMIAKKVLTSIFGGTELKFSGGEQNLMKQLGIEGLVNGIAKGGKMVKDFWTGFKDGVKTSYEAVKEFYGWMKDSFAPIFTFIGEKILGTFDTLSKLLGGDGFESFKDIQESASKLNEDMFNLGKMAGIALTAFLGFKAMRSIFGIFKNPFAGMITSARNATRAVREMGGAVRSVGGRVGGAITGRGRTTVAGNTNNIIRSTDTRGRVSTSGVGGMRGINRLGRDFANSSSRQSQADRNNLGVRHGAYQAMTPAQQANHDRRLSNARAQARGYNLNHATGRAGANALLDNMVARNNTIAGQNNVSNRIRNGQFHTTNAQGQQVRRTIHTAQQGRMSRALFGQRYDTFDEQGRRRTLARQGGLLRGRGADGRIQDRASMGTRMSQTAVRGMTRVQGVASAGANKVRTATAGARGAVGGAMRGAGSAVVNSKAMKPVTVPVRYVTERLKTAGIIKQGNSAGKKSGNMFKRAFNLATRTGMGGAKMFAGTVRAAGTAGARAGRGTLKGFGVVGKGITGIFKLGFRAIPFLGWALMAWDIISAVFTNWDAIVGGAKKAWNWIKNDGLEALQSAWEGIKNFAGIAWQWILTDGKEAFINIATSAVEFLGVAFTWILTKAGEAFVWILTDGIAMAVDLGAKFFEFIGDAFPKVVSFAIEKLGELVGAVVDIGTRVGSSIFEAIKSGFGDIAGWFGGKLSEGWSTIKGWFGGGGGDAKAKKYARGGIINSPHLGLVGEAGPEAIIPLSGNQRNRAQGLLRQVAGTLGMNVQNQSPKDTDINNFVGNLSGGVDEDGNRTKFEPVTRKSNPIIRKATSGVSGETGAGDNSVTISNVNYIVKDGSEINPANAKAHVRAFGKELQKMMKQERLRSKGKNLTLEDLILNI